MRSSNNGENWSEPQNLTEEYSYKGVPNVKLANGYGDPAIVADRESDKVLVLSVGGSYGFHQEYPGVVSMLSHDGGMTFEEPVPLAGKTIGTSAISDVPTDLGLYELDNGGSEIYSMFVTSGRIMQSRYIKVGSSYRIYIAAPAKIRGEKEFKNFVFYSDDFGETWNVLPGIAIHGGDEAKVEEEKTAIRAIVEKLPYSNLSLEGWGQEDYMDRFNSPVWEELYKPCLACGTCTFVCPTCQCYDIKDYDTGHGVQRYRCWDSCMYSDFTMMAHGNNRNSQMQRFRQRFMHKLVYYPVNNNGMFSCVGCGRCVEKCPSSLNIVKVIKAFENQGGEK